jgi:hypothetical protein
MIPDSARRSHMLTRVTGGMLALIGAVACAPPRHCLWGTVSSPYAGREEIQLIQREYARAEDAPGPMRARILEALPDLFPDLSDRADAPLCSVEIVERLAKDLDQRPLAYDDATLHELSALGRVEDTTDVMRRKAGILLRLAQIPDHAVRAYQPSPGEIGSAPSAAFLRHRALAALAGSNLFSNDARVRRFLADQVLRAGDARDDLLLVPSGREVCRDFSKELGPALVGKWLGDAAVRLKSPADPVAFELLLARVTDLGSCATRSRLGGSVRPLLQGIVAAAGQVPAARGIDGGARDLSVRALMALRDVDAPSRAPWGYDPQLPFPVHHVLPLSALSLDDATSMTWPETLLRRRLEALDREIADAGEDSIRCWAFRQRARWTPARQTGVLFGAWSTDKTLPVCALGAALDLESVTSSRRTRVATAVLREPRPLLSEDFRLAYAWYAITNHLAWVDESAELRVVMGEQALTEAAADLLRPRHDISSLQEIERRLSYQAALERAVRKLCASPQESERALGRSVVAHWIEIARGAHVSTFNDAYTHEFLEAILYAVAELAPSAGLESEVGDLFDGNEPYQQLARWLLEHARS